VLRELDALEQSDPRDPVAIALERAGRPLSSRGLVLQTGMPPEFVSEGLASLVSGGDVLTFEGQATEYLSKGAYGRLVSRATSLLEDFHEENPLAEGIARETLKKQLAGEWGAREADMLMERLQADGVIESDGRKANLPGRGASVTSEQEKMVADILEKIGATPFSPPAVTELAAELGAGRKTVADLLALAGRDGRVVRISPDLYFSPGAMSDIESALKAKLDADPEITVSEFRDLIGTSRKYALPLLEYFDRERLTVRQGDVRRLR
jgi:selenocysteine-specific elongation factor